MPLLRKQQQQLKKKTIMFIFSQIRITSLWQLIWRWMNIKKKQKKKKKKKKKKLHMTRHYENMPIQIYWQFYHQKMKKKKSVKKSQNLNHCNTTSDKLISFL